MKNRVVGYVSPLLLACVVMAASTVDRSVSCGDASGQNQDIQQMVDAADHLIRDRMLPYWLDNAIDPEDGGYIVPPNGGDPENDPNSKSLVYQSRMMYGFSLAQLAHFSNETQDYLSAARIGYEFFVAHFLDPEYGGYYWATDKAGNPTDTRKILYGQAQAIFGLVEYYRASGDPEPLQKALDLFRVISDNMRDGKHGGWLENFERNWALISDPVHAGPIESIGLKASNSYLHLLEAFTELLMVTGNADVRSNLREILEINSQNFFPPDPQQAVELRYPDWEIFGGYPSDGYGHNVENAWLVARAEKALGVKPDWDLFDTYMEHTIRMGWGRESLPAGLWDGREKVWWAQAELLAAIAEHYDGTGESKYDGLLADLWEYLVCFVIDPTDGIWIWSIEGDGSIRNGVKASKWKAAYHDIRGLTKFIDAYNLDN